tara:strand:- start:228 stop:521 length:294 start_codon:yes stop_codon:yes gene_type:complete
LDRGADQIIGFPVFRGHSQTSHEFQGNIVIGTNGDAALSVSCQQRHVYAKIGITYTDIFVRDQRQPTPYHFATQSQKNAAGLYCKIGISPSDGFLQQ